jgi:hypothetical protein
VEPQKTSVDRPLLQLLGEDRGRASNGLQIPKDLVLARQLHLRAIGSEKIEHFAPTISADSLRQPDGAN